MMLPLLLALLAPARAAGLHAGLPVRQAELGEPAFQSAENGWSAPMADHTGMIRAFVGRDEAAAVDWMARQRESFTRPLPDLDFADDAAGDGEGVLLFRDGNVGVLIRSDAGQARAWAERLRARIVDGAAPLPASVLEATAEGWVVDAPGAAAIRATGASARSSGSVDGRAVFAQRPSSVTVWDAYGRALVLR